MSKLLASLEPILSRVRQDVTWRKVGKETRLEKNTPIGKTVIEAHLRGIQQRGVAPILPGESTTRILVLDLDSHKGETPWPDMAAIATNFMAEFARQGFPAQPFRSTGGKGIHLIFTWLEPQDAYSVRKRFKEILDLTFDFKEGTKGVKAGEVEIFPKQDAVPKGGYGNMFILPLSGLSVPLTYNAEPMPLETQLDWLISIPINKIEKPVTVRTEPAWTGDALELKNMVDAIPNVVLDYDTWIKIGMALHAASGGSPEGFELWWHWSTQNPEHGPYEEAEYKWASFKSDKDNLVGVGSLKKMAAQFGWVEDFSLDFDPVEEEPEIIEVEDEPVKEQRHPYALIDVSKFVSHGKSQWLIKGILPVRSSSMIYGGSGDGKSFAALDMAFAIALGRPWRNLRVRRGRVVYICAEGANNFPIRLSLWARENTVDLTELDDWFSVIPASPNFMNKKDIEELVKQIKLRHSRVDLIVVDTMAQTTTGGDENSAKDMGIALKLIEQVRIATGSATQLIHHTGKDESRGHRGSTSIKGDLDAQFQVLRDGEDRLFWVDKVKDGIDKFGWHFELAIRSIAGDDDGDLTTSCVCVFEDEITHEKISKRKDDKPAHAPKKDPYEDEIWAAWDRLGRGRINIDDLVAEAKKNVPWDKQGRDTRGKLLGEALKRLEAKGELEINDSHVEGINF